MSQFKIGTKCRHTEAGRLKTESKLYWADVQCEIQKASNKRQAKESPREKWQIWKPRGTNQEHSEPVRTREQEHRRQVDGSRQTNKEWGNNTGLHTQLKALIRLMWDMYGKHNSGNTGEQEVESDNKTQEGVPTQEITDQNTHSNLSWAGVLFNRNQC